MNILILNWRDPKNPQAGGAEKLNVEIIKPLTHEGHSVTWYAMSHKGLPSNEIYQSIRIFRFGNIITHFLALPIFLLSKKFGEINFIIDSIHGIGYSTPILAPKTRKIVLICEVARNIWDDSWTFPINIIGKFLEKIMFLLYKHEKFWTISQSTVSDLVAYRIKRKQITILSMGFDIKLLENIPKKTKNPTALFVGRLAKMKGIEDAITAISAINKQQEKKWKLQIIGRGDLLYEQQLQKYVRKINLEKDIQFLGFVDEKTKSKYMASSWVLLVPSSREGWGMIVPEANALGTPVIGYNVPGLKEVLPLYAKENLCVSNDSHSLAKALKSISKPVYITKKPKRGWDSLHKQVKGIINS